MPFSNLRKISIDYDETTIQNMLSLVKSAPFPSQAPIDPNEPWSLGIDYTYLRDLKQKFEISWQWSRLEKEVNKFDHFLVDYASAEGDQLQLHFIHQKSERADAIPLFLLHGWPGTFYDFHKVIEPLVNPSSPELPAFHIVVPSIPGYFLSTLPRRHGWNLEDIGRLYNDLMVNLLGYKTYAAQGGDWGSIIARVMANQYPESLLSVHFNFFLGNSEKTDISKLSEPEKKQLERRALFEASGRAYSMIQGTKPFTIGIAIASSPLAILTYIGEKFHDWSDPSLIEPQDIIDTAALYYLSGSFATSVLMYNQAFTGRSGSGSMIDPRVMDVKSKAFGLSIFPYEIGSVQRAVASKFGNLAFYRGASCHWQAYPEVTLLIAVNRSLVHEHGGHFPALDSSNEFIADVRDFFSQNYA